MSSRPFGPEDVGPIRIRKSRFDKHRKPWGPMGRILCFTSLAVLPLCGLVWHLAGRVTVTASVDTRDRKPSKPVATERVTHGSQSHANPNLPAVPATAFSTTMIIASRQDTASSDIASSHTIPSDAFRNLKGIFESPDPVHGHNSVDDEVFRNLFAIGIKPAKLCSDEAFLRRVYIDSLGTLPTVREAKAFLDDHRENKRRELIDELLQRPEFADYWAMKWCDVLRVKAEFPINLWPNAAQAYHRWIHTSIKNSMPYDQFTRELLTSSGSNFRTPQVNFYRALQSKEPEAIASAVALTFLGERTDNWPEERLAGMAKFFGKVGYKPTGEWKEEIIYFDRRRGEAAADQNLTAVYPNGVSVTIPDDQDPRVVFASWLTNENNPWFARAIANRVWCSLVGRGIVHPPDDVRRDNPPSNLRLLDHLADQLVDADFDLKQLYRLILNSSVYQLSCIPQSDDPRAIEHFGFYQTRRLDAEVLIDAICQITATTETYMSIIPEPFTFLPDHQRAISLPDGSITSSFLELFGRPSRDTGMVSERNNRLTASQALHLLNSNHIGNKLTRGPGINELIEQGRDSWDTAELVYLAILSRRPTESELNIAGQLCDDPSGTRQLAWALINSDEFLFQH